MTNFTERDLHVSHTNKSLNLNKCSIMQEKNVNGDSWYIPSILKFSCYQPSQFSKNKMNI